MKYAVISGANSGLAEQVIKFLVENDYMIFALDISENIISKYQSEKSVVPFQVDITKSNEIESAKVSILKKTDHIDLVINFAGIVMLGSTIEIPAEKVERLIDINLMGMYRINQIFMDMVIKSKGRIINLSSEYGVLSAIPFHSFYTMSKHAIEIYNDSLRREISSYGVKVIKIRPGSFKTKMQGDITNQFVDLVNETKYFKKPLKKMKNIMVKELNKAADATKIVRTFKKAILSKKPRKVYNVHNSFKMKVLSHLPASVQDYIFASYFKAH